MLVAFDLLDRQILDRDGVPVGKVDDIELCVAADGGLLVGALLTGVSALGARFGGAVGRWAAARARRPGRFGGGPRRIPYHLVARVDSAVHLRVGHRRLPAPPLEAWLGEHVVGRIPGAGDDR